MARERDSLPRLLPRSDAVGWAESRRWALQGARGPRGRLADSADTIGCLARRSSFGFRPTCNRAWSASTIRFLVSSDHPASQSAGYITGSWLDSARSLTRLIQASIQHNDTDVLQTPFVSTRNPTVVSSRSTGNGARSLLTFQKDLFRMFSTPTRDLHLRKARNSRY